MHISKCTLSFSDPRMKGFSENGTFLSDSYKSFYSLSAVSETHKDDNLFAFLEFGIITSYHLATQTTFFGKKFHKKWSNLYANKNVVFMAQKVSKSVGINSTNVFGMKKKVKYFFL